jgi:hypothetical protein
MNSLDYQATLAPDRALLLRRNTANGRHDMVLWVENTTKHVASFTRGSSPSPDNFAGLEVTTTLQPGEKAHYTLPVGGDQNRIFQRFLSDYPIRIQLSGPSLDVTPLQR